MSFLYIPLKHVIVIFFIVINFIPVCVCDAGRADFDEGCLSSEKYGTVCKPSSNSTIIKAVCYVTIEIVPNFRVCVNDCVSVFVRDRN